MERHEDEEERSANHPKGLKKSLYIILWLLCILLYIAQLVSTTWSAALQFIMGDYVLFCVILTPLVFPSVILSIISLVWYRDQDKVNQYLQESHPTDGDLHNLKPLLRWGAILSHVTGLGVLYR